MKHLRIGSTVILFAFTFQLFVSCSKDDSVTESPVVNTEVKFIKLELEDGNQIYKTNISGTNIALANKLSFFTEDVTVKSIEYSPNSNSTLKVGDILKVDQTNHSIKVSSNNSSNEIVYTLKLEKDEGLKISPSSTINNSTSYNLHNSAVYVNGNQLEQNFEKFYINGYGDFNSDGNVDVLLASGIFKSYTYSPVTLYLGNGNAFNSNYCECGGPCNNFACDGFTKKINPFSSNFEGFQHPRKILTGDFNNDGKLDAFIIGHGYDAPPFPGEAPALLINNGNGFDVQKLNQFSGFNHGAASGDIDNDGDLDIIITGAPSSTSMQFLINDGLANFTSNTTRLDNYTNNNEKYYTTELIDIDKDGYLDLIIGGHEYEGAKTYVLWGNSYGKYFLELSTVLPSVSNFGIVVDIDSADIDNDGDEDLILNRVSGGGAYGFYEKFQIQILVNSGNRTFVDKTTSSITNNEGNQWRTWVHLQDLDGDSDIDIYYEGQPSNLKWLNNGSGVYNLQN